MEYYNEWDKRLKVKEKSLHSLEVKVETEGKVLTVLKVLLLTFFVSLIAVPDFFLMFLFSFIALLFVVLQIDYSSKCTCLSLEKIAINTIREYRDDFKEEQFFF